MQHTPHPRPHIPLGLIVGLVVVVTVPIVGCGAFAWLQWAALTSSYPFVTDTIRIAAFLLPVVPGAYARVTGVTILWRRYGWRESVYADKQAAMMRATKQIAPLATNFHYELNNDVEDCLKAGRKRVAPSGHQLAAAGAVASGRRPWHIGRDA